MGIFDFLRRREPDPEPARETPPTERGVGEVFAELERLRRRASVAEIGGFRPLDDPRASWFGRGVGLPGEGLPVWDGRELFPMLQVNVGELPYVPEELAGIALLVLFFDREELPLELPYGEGWAIREYASLDGLVPLPSPREPLPVRPFPVRWRLVEDEAPGWQDAGDLVDLGPVAEDDAASDAFFERFSNHPYTKVGGYPTEVQYSVGLDGFVLQVGSEEKVGWEWVDRGCAYFFRSEDGEWRWDCQFL